MDGMSGFWNLADALESPDGQVESTRLGTVSRIESDGMVYVRFAGSDIDMPVHSRTVEVSPGDAVNVTIERGRASIGGSASDPAAGIVRVVQVERKADTALADASRAYSAANAAEADAQRAHDAADSAQASAHAAQNKLSDVENVVGTLNWIAEHGTWTAATETAPVADRIYYTRTGSGTSQDPYKYTVVPEVEQTDNPAALGWYYLVVDESVQAYLASHLWLDNYGLNLSVDSANGYRIHQGTVDGTKTVGTYIIDPNGNDVAKFGADGAQIGKTSAAHVEISQKAVAVSTGGFATDKRFVAGLANDPVTGLATIELFGVLDSIQIKSGVEYYAIENGGIEPTSFTAIEIDGVSHSVTGLSYSDTAILLDKAEYAGYSRSVAKITYATEDPVPTMFYGTSYNVSGVNTGSNSAAFGYTSSALGLASFAAGYNAGAWGACSAAIGRNSDAYGRDSAAFGYGTETEAKGIGSVALGHNAKTSAMFAISAGNGVVAQNLEETVLGAYNDYANDVNPYGRTQYNNRGKYALIIGNGTADDARSNALAVTWDGAIECAADTAWTTLNSTIKYRIHHGVCYVCGDSVSGGTSVGTSGTTVGTLPTGARPSITVMGAASTKSNAANGQFSIDSSGAITVWNLSTSSPYWCFTASYPVG